MLLLIGRLWPVVCYLVPGALLGFGFAVLPYREVLGKELSPCRRWLLRALPEAALSTGWLLMAATLLVRWGCQELPGLFPLACCLALDFTALGGLTAWALRERRLAEQAIQP